MTPLIYAARVTEAEPGEFVVTFPDVPEALTSGADLREALGNASDALTVAIEGYIESGRTLPAPREATLGEYAVVLDVGVAARAMLVEAMADQGLSKVALAQRLGRDEKVVRRILTGRGASLELTLAALAVLGLRPALAS